MCPERRSDSENHIGTSDPSCHFVHPYQKENRVMSQPGRKRARGLGSSLGKGSASTSQIVGSGDDAPLRPLGSPLNPALMSQESVAAKRLEYDAAKVCPRGSSGCCKFGVMVAHAPMRPLVDAWPSVLLSPCTTRYVAVSKLGSAPAL